MSVGAGLYDVVVKSSRSLKIKHEMEQERDTEREE